ncbi:MAG TPA: nucleotidyltransferase family protein [bacterium]|nr:nucleotidyltransferase family protein [bacterium]
MKNNGKPGDFSPDTNKKLILHQMSAMILAGGESRRFGAPKVLQSFCDKPFLTRIVDALTASELRQVYLVLGYKAETFRRKLPETGPLYIVKNPEYKYGQFSSIQAGIKALDNETLGVLSCLIDQPHILPYTYHAVIMSACSAPNKIIIPTYQSRGGHPVYIPSTLFPEIVSSPPSWTLRDIFDDNSEEILRVEINDPGLTEDIDTKKDLRRIEVMYAENN